MPSSSVAGLFFENQAVIPFQVLFRQKGCPAGQIDGFRLKATARLYAVQEQSSNSSQKFCDSSGLYSQDPVLFAEVNCDWVS